MQPRISKIPANEGFNRPHYTAASRFTASSTSNLHNVAAIGKYSSPHIHMATDRPPLSSAHYFWTGNKQMAKTVFVPVSQPHQQQHQQRATTLL